jgi:hypothetical protein
MDGMQHAPRIVILGAGGTGLLMADSVLKDPTKWLAGTGAPMYEGFAQGASNPLPTMIEGAKPWK